MCAVRVRTEKGIVTDAVDIGEAVGVELEYEVLQPGHVLVPNFGFSSDAGVSLFRHMIAIQRGCGALGRLGAIAARYGCLGTFLEKERLS